MYLSERLKGRIDESYRISILTLNAAPAVYRNNRFEPANGEEGVTSRFGATIVKYEPSVEGWRIRVMRWFFGERTYASIVKVTDQLRMTDLILTCVHDDYQQYDVQTCPSCVWAADSGLVKKVYRTLPTAWEATIASITTGFKAPGLTLNIDVARHWSELPIYKDSV